MSEPEPKSGERDRPATNGAGDEDVKLPRGKWFGNLRGIEIIRIGMVATVLVVVIMLGRPCADGMARFIESYAPPPDAGQAPVQYERLTEEEIRRRFPSGEEPRDAATAP